ncbi:MULTISPECIES: conjugal transfer mating pair stabilization protein TraN [Enterobacterales]|uniref:Conjugal transfer mating pair stabilization protein TraN n=11 Tax=Morganellaceae TaxID=1903414 RepID=A0AAI9HVB2_MORMO|nr:MULTISPECIES: conjugal transfer mating pair stabilization protein TraN [Enterobacterales]EKW8762942.1 conjugal transfer mating pair stabilization protein TraN [Morganella morganii]MEB1123103.1 conjugal transfer mating pair stabilization protein TraN [Citrobacter freundii]AGX85641.1 TraN [Providencia rettgeri]ARD70812.1 TraN [Providencia rettgeri]ARV76088.1 conjugal transfer mating pair stabilization protein TraN [Providencia rettgeri]
MIQNFRRRNFSSVVTHLSLIAYLSVMITPVNSFAEVSTKPPENTGKYQTDKNNLEGVTAGHDTAKEALNFYKTLPSLNVDSKGTSQFGKGESVNFNNIYYKDSFAMGVDDVSNVYGNDSKTNEIGFHESKKLKTEQSPKGEAYRTLVGASRHSSIDINKDDDVFNVHNDFLSNEKKYSDAISKCETKQVFEDYVDKKHIPDYKECTKTVDVTGGYIVNHPYLAGLVSHNSGPANIKTCGETCVDIWLGKVGDDYWKGNCRIFEDYMSVNVINPTAVISAKITRAKWDDYMQIYAGTSTDLEQVWGGPHGKDVFPPETPGRCELSTSWDQQLNVDVTEKFSKVQPNDEVFFKNRVSVTGAGEGFAQLRIQFDKKKALTNDVWSSPQQSEFNKAVKAIKEGFCQDYTVVCHDTIIPDKDGCAVIDGVKLCKEDFVPPPLDKISPFCKRAEVITHCGKEHGVNNTCKKYEKQGCSFIKSQCLTGKEGDIAGCWQSSETWDCGKDVTFNNGAVHEKLICDGAVQCLNGSCLRPSSQENGDFATAAAMLNAASFALADTNCADAEEANNGESSLNKEQCVIFKGEALTCRTAMGGWVDCCDQPVGVSWIEYVQLSMMTMRAADALAIEAGLFDGGVGLFDMASTAAMDAVEAITKPAISAFNSFVGNAGAEVAQGVAEKGVVSMTTAALNNLTTKVAEWTANTFGEAVTNAIFQSAATEGGKTATQSLAENGGASSGASVVQLSSTITTAMSVVGYAYLAYQMANLLVNIIWACTDEEFKLAIKKETKLATKVDSWCSKKVLGACIEKKSSYCAYNSQVARIITEHVRGTIGYGDTKNPNCEGITLADMDKVDFTKIDFSEWTATLKEADMLPDFKEFDLDKYTGSGSTLNADGKRVNSVERFTRGVEGTDLEEVRQRAKTRLSVKDE